MFFNSSLGKRFFLTGGTALAAFYLAHRVSKDLDLFTLEDFDRLELEKLVEEIARKIEAQTEIKVQSKTYNEIYLKSKREKWTQRIDFVREQPVIFGKRKKIDFVIVDSLENIASGKILTVYSRLEPKDYLDLYFIFRETGLDFSALFERTKQKDLGLNEFYFANMISEVKNFKHFPQTLKPFKKRDLEKFFLDLAQKLYAKIKPKE